MQDPNIGELVVSLFGELIKEVSGDECLTMHFTWMANVLNNQNDMVEYCAVPFVIQMLTSVFENGSDQIITKAADALVGCLCHLLLGTGDSSILISASKCLAALLHRCPQACAVTVLLDPSLVDAFLAPGEGKSVCGVPPAHSASQDDYSRPHPLSSVLVAIVMAMLREDQNELSLMNVGKLLVAIAQNTGGFRDDEITLLITAIVRRLMSVRTIIVAQELLVFFAVLLKLHMHTVINILLSSGLLVNVFSIWLSKMSKFFGGKDLFCFCDVLLDLLLHWPMENEICGQMLPWDMGGGQKLSLPLDVALFVAVGKGVLNLADQDPASEGEEEEENEWGEGDGSEEEEEEQEENMSSDGEESAGVKENVGTMSHELRVTLQRVLSLVPQYGAAAANFFSRAEKKKLSALLGTVGAAAAV